MLLVVTFHSFQRMMKYSSGMRTVYLWIWMNERMNASSLRAPRRTWNCSASSPIRQLLRRETLQATNRAALEALPQQQQQQQQQLAQLEGVRACVCRSVRERAPLSSLLSTSSSSSFVSIWTKKNLEFSVITKAGEKSSSSSSNSKIHLQSFRLL